MKRLALGLLTALLLCLPAKAQVPNWPQTLPANSVVGRLGIGAGPAQAIPFANLTGNLLSAVSGDCSINISGVITCTKTNGVAFAPIATSGSATNLTAGTVPAARMPALTGDVTSSAGAVATTISNNAVSNAKAAQATANTIKGNWTASTANVADNTMPSCPDSAGNHLNYVNGTGVTCGSTSAGVSIVLLNTLTASSSATLNDLTSFTSTYSVYELVFENVIPATGTSSCEIQVHSGGSYQATSYLASQLNANGSTSAAGTTTTFIPCSVVGNAQTTGPGINGTLRITAPSGTAVAKFWQGTVAHNGSGVTWTTQIGGYWNNTAAVDGFQVLFSAGNITSGIIKVYGVL